jgi:diphosphomevalonate decarboxylase
MKTTATAPANIAFIKYWGKKNEELRIPANASISMNLSGATTTTTVEFSSSYPQDVIELTGGNFSDSEAHRIAVHLDRIRQKSGIRDFAHVITKNSFPKGTGIASSASGFAALTVAAAKAAGLSITEKELTILARLGSGSACRSIPDGFVKWESGEKSEESYAHSIFPHDYWDIRDVLIIVDATSKKISSADGMKHAATSPFWQKRQKDVREKIVQITNALEKKNFFEFGTILEEDCLSMHSVMMTQSPPLTYWNDATGNCIRSVQKWRKDGLLVFFTIDAGPNVHCICEGKNEKRLIDAIKTLSGVQSTLVNSCSCGTHITDTHLY